MMLSIMVRKKFDDQDGERRIDHRLRCRFADAHGSFSSR